MNFARFNSLVASLQFIPLPFEYGNRPIFILSNTGGLSHEPSGAAGMFQKKVQK